MFCYSFGFRTPDEQWRTIMSSSPGTFVNLYSSPLLDIDGQALGIDGDGDVGITDFLELLGNWGACPMP